MHPKEPKLYTVEGLFSEASNAHIDPPYTGGKENYAEPQQQKVTERHYIRDLPHQIDAKQQTVRMVWQ